MGKRVREEVMVDSREGICLIERTRGSTGDLAWPNRIER